jgi:hypothetical protein
MSAEQITRTIVFEGAGGRYEVPSKQWAEMLLLLEDRGWQPEQLRTSYLATAVQISNSESRNLAEIGRRVLEAALTDPASVYPVSFDMAKFHEFVEFSEASGIPKEPIEEEAMGMSIEVSQRSLEEAIE